MEAFLQDWGYLGIFVGILLTGVGFPMPEELPIGIAGGLARGFEGEGKILWWVMLPVCIVGVVIGDGLLYGIGRLWGPRLLEFHWVKTRLLPPERREKIERNFHEHGIKILLFARLTPGIRGTIFFTAGTTRLPLARFLIADGIYAIPGVSLLFTLGYYFTEQMVNLSKDAERVKSIIILLVVLGVAGYFLYRFLRRPMVTGDPKDMPPMVGPVTHTLEQVTGKIIHSKPKTEPSPDGAAGHSDPTKEEMK